MLPKVKICCISSHEEAQMAIEAGASALGLVGPMPSGPGIISDQLISAIASKTPPAISTFLLTSRIQAKEIIAHQRIAGSSTVQIVDKLQEGTYHEIKKALPGIKIIQVIHVRDSASITEAIKISREVDALLLDSGNPDLSTKELGGTGRTHNWEISKELVKSVKIPVFLAGGLNPLNVVQAIEKVQPYGLDICSGVRTKGKLDPKKLKAFFKAIRSMEEPAGR